MNFRRPILISLILTAVLGIASATAHAQGCAQCRDSATATPRTTQRAYRHAIILLTVTAGIFFVGTITLVRRRR
jgi:predicted small integral membrane protein